jgi:predicted MFS family arabinose efflux permease
VSEPEGGGAADRRGSTHGTYRRVLANGEALGLLVAQTMSDLGDQAARVAVALLVLDETGDLLYSALALAIAYLPGVLGEAVLGTLADRYPRRAIMLACDLLRLVLIAGLAVIVGHSPPLLVVYLVLLLSEFVAMPFGTARAALYVDVVPDRADYITAQGLSRTVYLLTQVVGAVVGGFLVDLVGVGPTLAFDALTFLFSFLVVRLYVHERGVADEAGTSASRILSDVGIGVREIFSDPVRRAITLLGWVSALFLVAPEAVALGYRPGLSGATGGALLAAVPAGSAVGALLVPRLSLRDQLRLLLPLAALSCLPLFATSVNPPPAVAGALWFVAGVLQAYVLTVIAAVTMFTARERRGRVLGVASAGFNLLTAVAFVVTGWVAGIEGIGPARAVSLAGAAGLVCVALLRAVWPSEEIRRAA